MNDDNVRTLTDKVREACERLAGDFPDGYVVMDYTSEGYAEPGYSSDTGVIVFGNWNPRRFPRDGEPALSDDENIGPMLADELETLGVDLEWHDEWTTCADCYRALRTTGDSYGWTLFGAFSEDGYVCSDCTMRDVDSYVADYVNDPDRAITWCKSADLIAIGFAQWAPDDPQTFESGWHPGQTDDPRDILASILATDEDAEVVFLIDNVGQFDVRFSAYVRSGGQ